MKHLKQIHLQKVVSSGSIKIYCIYSFVVRNTDEQILNKFNLNKLISKFLIMKKLLLVATFAVAGITGSITAKTSDTADKNLKVESKCYKEAVDDFGNHYYAQVPCPPVIIIQN